MPSISGLLTSVGRSTLTRVPDETLAGLGLQRSTAGGWGALGWVGVGIALGACPVYLGRPENRARLRSLGVRLSEAVRSAPTEPVEQAAPAGSSHRHDRSAEVGGR